MSLRAAQRLHRRFHEDTIRLLLTAPSVLSLLRLVAFRVPPLDVPEQRDDRGGSDAADALRRRQRRGPRLFQLLPVLRAQPNLDAVVVQVHGKLEPFLRSHHLHLTSLALEVRSVVALDERRLHGAGIFFQNFLYDRRRRRQLVRRAARAVKIVARVHGVHGVLVALGARAGTRVAQRVQHAVEADVRNREKLGDADRFPALPGWGVIDPVFSPPRGAHPRVLHRVVRAFRQCRSRSRRVAPGRIHQPAIFAVRGQAQVGVVGTNGESVLDARGKHAVRLGRSPARQVVHEDAEVAAAAAHDGRRERLQALKLQRLTRGVGACKQNTPSF